MKEWVKTLKEWNQKGVKDVVFPNYVFKKALFRGALILCFIVLGILLFKYGSVYGFSQKNFYYHCPEESGGCVNPFYETEFNTDYSVNVACPVNDPLFCESPRFLPGYSYGTPPPKKLYGGFSWFVIATFLVAFLVNHFFYNKRGGGKIEKN